MEEVGNPISINDFIDQLKKIGVARIRVEIDATMLLKLGVLIKRKNKVF